MIGFLLVGHGTRSEVGVRQFIAIGHPLAQRLAPLPVEPAFLELQQPDIETSVARLVARGIDRLVAMPLLLFAAAHAKQDIPDAVKSSLVRENASTIEQLQTAHLGCHPALVELSVRRMHDVMGSDSPCDCLLLVGRGSHDDSATAEMIQFARLRAAGLPDANVEVAFLAMARPLLAEELGNIARHGYRRIVVQPHLLFYGELVDAVARHVADARAEHPEVEWLLTPPLADPPGQTTIAGRLIEKVILDRCLEAGIHVVERDRAD